MHIITRTLRNLARIRPGWAPVLREEFRNLQFSGHAMQKLLDEYAFKTVLDIGSGEGCHADIFTRHEKKVTAIDYGESVYFRKHRETKQIELIIADFNEYMFDNQFDCVWCSHILEHQLNPHSFLSKVNSTLKETGILAITVPPLKNEVVGGHVSLWNAGMLLYHLVLAGLDCKEARVLRYGYNVSVILRKKSVNALSSIAYDAGDIRKIKKFLPNGFKFYSNDIDDPFDGNIYQLNWETPHVPPVFK